ncbi:MAG: FAD-dependent monooxygenase [Sandaracinaceae bacterium]
MKARVIEHASKRRGGSRATDVHSRTLELLDAHGVVGALREAGKTVRSFNAFSDGRRVSRLDFDALASRYPFTVAVPQRATEAILEDALAVRGVRVERGVTLDALEPGAPSRVTLSGPEGRETFEARFVVGCDGIGSAVREAVGIGYPGTTYATRYLVADVAMEWALPADEVHLFMHPEGFLNVIALPGAQVRILADRGPEDRSPPSLARLRELVAGRTHLPFRLGDATMVADFRVQCRLASSYRRGGVLLAGDAAHTCSPLLGQGMNLGLHDAVALGWRLAAVVRGEAAPSLLDGYALERRPVGLGILVATDLAHRLSRLRGARARQLRDAAFVLGSSIPWARRSSAAVTATSGDLGGRLARLARSPELEALAAEE